MELTVPELPLADLERKRVEECLLKHQGNRTHAARELGISPRTIQRMAKLWKLPDAPTQTVRRIAPAATIL